MRLKTIVKSFLLPFVFFLTASTAAASSQVLPPADPLDDNGPVFLSASFSEPMVKDADYWINKGNLVATYGNDKAAIGFYKKALKLEPNNSAAHFNLGISYGELGQYKNAVDAITRAISLNPGEGNYYYGRGRVYLLSGNRKQAMKDFHTAAEMGNRDAREYLTRRNY